MQRWEHASQLHDCKALNKIWWTVPKDNISGSRDQQISRNSYQTQTIFQIVHWPTVSHHLRLQRQRRRELRHTKGNAKVWTLNRYGVKNYVMMFSFLWNSSNFFPSIWILFLNNFLYFVPRKSSVPWKGINKVVFCFTKEIHEKDSCWCESNICNEPKLSLKIHSLIESLETSMKTMNEDVAHTWFYFYLHDPVIWSWFMFNQDVKLIRETRKAKIDFRTTNMKFHKT